ncbi:MAG: hypothetical protein JNN32_05380 [Flavobacteriales bacterium]|nr:hypothetical protein [Flavobacteriales bacterium]
MLRLRLLASWSLLLVVAFSVLPKDALHGLVHRIDIHASAQDGAQVDEVCALCAPSALVADQSTSWSGWTLTLVFLGLVVMAQARLLPQEQRPTPVRGPPALVLA